MGFYLGHESDDILGRTGVTLDWPRTSPGVDLTDWGKYFHNMPIGWRWYEGLNDDTVLFAKSAVRPFAIYYESQGNFVLMSIDLWNSDIDFTRTFRFEMNLRVRFGTTKFVYKDYVALRLLNHGILEEPKFSPDNSFFEVEFSEYHIFGTRVAREVENRDERDLVVKSGISFKSYEEFHQARKLNHNTYFLECIGHPFAELPLAFSTPLSLYCRHDFVEQINLVETPGMDFPYSAVPICAE